MISVQGLTRRFRDVIAVDDLSFEVTDGTLFALLGENGAGKSTTIACLSTLLDFDAGVIDIDGLTRPGTTTGSASRSGWFSRSRCSIPF